MAIAFKGTVVLLNVFPPLEIMDDGAPSWAYTIGPSVFEMGGGLRRGISSCAENLVPVLQNSLPKPQIPTD